jgi:hypothetical protein
MSLVEQLNRPGRWWVIEMAPDNRRVMAQVFEHPNGIVFADIGWDDNGYSGHPFHVIEGELKIDGNGYCVGQVRIIEIEEDDPLCLEWLGWVNYINSAAGHRATREACLAAIASTLPGTILR